MFFDGEEGEGDFGPPPGKSKLSSLFGMDRANNQGGNESLTYTAPKQPKKGSKGSTSREGAASSSSTAGQSALLLAVAVHAYRFSNGTYIKHGKLGAAILGNHTANDYKVLLYISKQQQVTHARVTPHFVFTTQANNYATFYDEQRQNWSIMFESEQNAEDFAKQVGLAKLNASGGITRGVIQQDLSIGAGDPVSEGDSVEVKYTGWLYQNRAFGSVFDSNASVDKAFRFKIGRGKVIKGWEEGVISMKKGGRRLLLIPPSLAYGKKGLGSRIPANSTLIFDVEIKKVKVSKDKDETGSVSSDAMEVGSLGAIDTQRAASPRVDGMSSDETVKTRSASLTEQMSSSPASTSKAKLISRMAKMGQPMLPLQGAAIAADSTDESEVDENSASDTGYPSLPAHPQHPRSKPMKTARKPPTTSAKPDQQLPMAGDQMMQQQPGMQMPMQNNTAGIPHASQGLTHTVAVYQPQMQPQQQPFQTQAQVQQQPMGMQGMGQQQAFQSTTFHGTAQQYPFQQQYQGQPTDPNILLQQQAAAVAAQQTLQQQQQFGGARYPVTSQALIQPVVSELPLLLSESRQHHTDLKLVVDMVSGKIDNLATRVEKLNFQTTGAAVPTNVPNLEANILMQNISRIVQENERLKKEVHEKGNKIETQNEKIAELIQRNQMFVEQSNTLMEKRNDSFKQTTTQSQARVLEMEQEKVQLTTDLSNTTAKISALQLELTAVQQREMQLKTQLNTGMNTNQEHLSEMEAMRVKQQESDWKITELTRNLKDEKQEKKQLSNRLVVMEEELSDAKMEKDTIDKNFSERKRKATMDKQRLDQEMEELKKQYEEEINSLQNKLRLQKSTKDVVTAEQVAQVERDLELQWRERSERLLTQATEKHERMLSELHEEKEVLAKKLAQTEQKMIALRSGQGDVREQAEKLKEQLSDMSGWKEKYDGLHSSAVSMKERYEERIKELIKDKETRDGAASQSNVIDEVKKIMNSVYHTLRSEFELGGTYKGAEILNTIMNTIKLVTLQLVKRSSGGSTGEEEDSEEEDEDEEDEEEEEEEEAEEEEEEVEDEQAPVQKVEESVLQSSAPVQEETAQTSATPTALPQANEDIPDLPDVPDEKTPSEEESDQEGEETTEQDAGNQASGDQEVSQSQSPSTVEQPGDEDDVGPPELPPESPSTVVQPGDEDDVGPPELPPELPPEVLSDEEEEATAEEVQDNKMNERRTQEETAPDEVPDIPAQDDMDDLPDFSPEGNTHEEDTPSRAAPPAMMSPPPFLPDLPPELPPDDMEQPKTKSSTDDIFGDDDDDDEFFSTPPTKRKEVFGKPLTKDSPSSDNDDSVKPNQPPPLFGSEEDDDDDLDWLSNKK